MRILTVIIAHHYYKGSAATNRILAYALGFRELGLKVKLVLAGVSDFDIDQIQGVDIYKCIAKHRNQGKKMAECIKKIYIKDNSVILTYGTPTLCWYLPKTKYNIFYECTEIPFYGRKKTINSWLKEYVKKYLSLRATGMLVISKSLKNYFHNLGIENIAVINMFVDIDRFKNVEQKKSEKYIAYCGWVSEYKDGVDVLIKAFNVFSKQHNEYKLYIIGDFISKNDEINLLNLVASLGLTDKIVFTGKVTPAIMPSYLCGAQMLALARPNNEQAKYGFPTKLGEYLATGNPVVVTRVGEIGDFLRDGVNCKMSEPDDPNSFAQSLSWVADNYNDAIKLGQGGKKLTEDVFSSKTQVLAAFEFMCRVSSNKL